MSGITLSPIALALGVCAYLGKRWWDSAEAVRASRMQAYSRFFSAAYDLTRISTDAASDHQERVRALEVFHQAVPDFYVYGSPTALVISDVFFERWRALASVSAVGAASPEFQARAHDLSECLNVLRELVKTELFWLVPKFFWERRRYKARYNKLLEKLDQTKSDET